MCFVSAYGFHNIDSGMSTIDKTINPIKDLPLTVSLKDLSDIAKKRNIRIKELREWLKMYFDLDEQYNSINEHEQINKIIKEVSLEQ